MMTAVTAVVIISIAATALRTVSAIGCYRTLTKAEYPFCVQLDPGLVLMYKTTADGNLVLAADVDGWAAWIAVGVSEAGLKGVDYTVLIRGVQAQTWVTGDYFSLNATMIPTLDDEQNAELLVAPVQVRWFMRHVCVHFRMHVLHAAHLHFRMHVSMRIACVDVLRTHADANSMYTRLDHHRVCNPFHSLHQPQPRSMHLLTPPTHPPT